MSERKSHSRPRTSNLGDPSAARPAVGESFGRRAIFVAGVVQSVDAVDAASGYWKAMLPEHRPEKALLLGVGGGTVAHLLVERFGAIEIIGIEESAAMVQLASIMFDLGATGIRIVEADALTYVHQTDERFDFIAVDLYRGDRLVRAVLTLPFLGALAALCKPGGSVAFNLFADSVLAERLGRIERRFDRTRLVDVGANAVFHGRPHRRRR